MFLNKLLVLHIILSSNFSITTSRIFKFFSNLSPYQRTVNNGTHTHLIFHLDKHYGKLLTEQSRCEFGIHREPSSFDLFTRTAHSFFRSSSAGNRSNTRSFPKVRFPKRAISQLFLCVKITRNWRRMALSNWSRSGVARATFWPF